LKLRTLPTRVASAAVLALLALAAARPVAAEVVGKIVLRINDRIATQHDYDIAREDLRREISRKNLDPQERDQALASAGEVVFKNLYEDLLLQSRADQLNITASEQEVDASVQQMRENFNITSDEQFRGALAQSGMTEQDLRDNLRKNLRVRELVGREVQGKIKLEEDDLRRYYQKNVDLFRVPEQIHLREAVILSEKCLPKMKLSVAQAKEKYAGQRIRVMGKVTNNHRDPNLTGKFKIPHIFVDEPSQFEVVGPAVSKSPQR